MAGHTARFCDPSSSDLADVFMDFTLSKPEPQEQENDADFNSCKFTQKSSSSSTSTVATEPSKPGVSVDNEEGGHSESQPVAANSGATSECVVCNDKATGYHYGVFTCEGCKGFFKRTVQKQLEYTCKGDGNCEVNQLNRNRCQYCRFQKCMAQGMLKEAVREDRTPGGRHRHRSLQDHRPKKQRGREDAVNGSADGNDCVEGALKQHKKEESAAGKGEYMAFIENIRDQAVTMPHIEGLVVENESTKEKDVNTFMQLAYQELNMIIQWAKDVPGFKDIDLEDQVCLIKASFMELNVFRLAYRSVPCDPMSLRFSKELIFDKHEVIAFGWTEDLVDTTLEFTDKLRSLNLDQNEFALLSALALLSPDTPDLKDKEKITGLQEKVNIYLRDYSKALYPQKANRLGKLLLCLPTLRIYSEKAMENYVTLEFFGKLDMPPLVAELLE